MLINKLDADEFLKEFDARFDNFCTSSPISLSFITGEKGVTIFVHYKEESKSFNFEFVLDKTPKENIHKIKKILQEKYYPMVIKKTSIKKEIPIEEVDRLVAEGKDLDEVLLMTQEQELVETFYFDKFFIDKNVIILVSQEDEKNKILVEFLKPLISIFSLNILNSERLEYDYEDIVSQAKLVRKI